MSRLSDRLCVAIRLRTAQLHGCAPSLAAHSAHARGLGASEDEVAKFRRGHADDPREQALLALVSKVVCDHGRNARYVLDLARSTGWDDAEIYEAVAVAALCSLTDYLASLTASSIE